MKKIFTLAFFLLTLVVSFNHANAQVTFEKNLFPITTDTYDLGSTSPAKEWNNLFVKNVTVSGTCTGCTSGGSISGSGGAGLMTAWSGLTTLVATSAPTGAFFTATDTAATSTMQGLMAKLLKITANATSSFADGIQLSGGCFAMPNGACLGNGVPSGSNTQVQFNNAGQFGGDSMFVYSKALSQLSVPNISATSTLDTNGVLTITNFPTPTFSTNIAPATLGLYANASYLQGQFASSTDDTIAQIAGSIQLFTGTISLTTGVTESGGILNMSAPTWDGTNWGFDGNLTIDSGSGVGTAFGQNINIQSGDGGATNGGGGQISLTAGSGGGGDAQGGQIILQDGLPTGVGVEGGIKLIGQNVLTNIIAVGDAQDYALPLPFIAGNNVSSLGVFLDTSLLSSNVIAQFPNISGIDTICFQTLANCGASLLPGGNTGDVQINSGGTAFAGGFGQVFNSLVSLGSSAGQLENTTNSDDVALGAGALQSGTSNSGASHNVAIGNNALPSIDSVQNVAVGQAAGQSLTSGNSNVFLGYSAALFSTSTSNSVIIGNQAFRGNGIQSNSNSDVMIGTGAGAGTNIKNNIFLGSSAGANATFAFDNTIIGNHTTTDNITSGGGNILIGKNAFIPDGTKNLQMSIGNLLFGNLPATTTTAAKSIYPLAGAIGVATSTPWGMFAISANSGYTGNNNVLFTIASSSLTATTTLFQVTNRGDIYTNTPVTGDTTRKPVVGVCGTATASATSTDMRGTITVTAGTPTSCTVTFSSAKQDTPTCIADGPTAALGAVGVSASTSGALFNLPATFSGSFRYICML